MSGAFPKHHSALTSGGIPWPCLLACTNHSCILHTHFASDARSFVPATPSSAPFHCPHYLLGQFLSRPCFRSYLQFLLLALSPQRSAALTAHIKKSKELSQGADVKNHVQVKESDNAMLFFTWFPTSEVVLWLHQVDSESWFSSY